LYKQLLRHIEACVPCQQRNLRARKAPLQEMDVAPFPFAKVSLFLSGSYPTSLSGNRYIVSFVDHYSGWPEAFAVSDKTADTIAYLFMEHIFPRYGCPLQLVTDNGTENCNRVMQETLEALNIRHVTTSFYHPQSNAKVERFHRTLHDIISKKLEDNLNTWDLFLNQSLAAVRFCVSETTKFSPYYLVYNRDVILPIDNLLMPRRRYLGEDRHQIALEQQHKAFVTVQRNLQKARKRQAKYAQRNTHPVELKVGDPVYVKLHARQNKLQSKWQPYFRIMEQPTPVTFVIRNQLDGRTIRTHADHLRLAKIDEWNLPRDDAGYPVQHNRKVFN